MYQVIKRLVHALIHNHPSYRYDEIPYMGIETYWCMVCQMKYWKWLTAPSYAKPNAFYVIYATYASITFGKVIRQCIVKCVARWKTVISQIVKCGTHSAIPSCCISYFLQTKYSERHLVLQDYNVGYLTCPYCRERKAFIKVKPCEC